MCKSTTDIVSNEFKRRQPAEFVGNNLAKEGIFRAGSMDRGNAKAIGWL